LNAEGVNTAFAINDFFGLFEGPLLVDSDLEAADNSAALRTNGGGQDWYESRNDDPGLLTLDESDIGGNTGKKALITASASASAYLTQRFGRSQDDMFAVRWEINVDAILDDANRDRSAMMLIGDGGGTTDGPNSTDSERFVYMAFWSPDGGGDDPGDTMSLIALEPGGSTSDSSTWTEIASGLDFDTWHTITVASDLTSDTYHVYINDDIAPVATVAAYTAKSSLTHISFAQGSESAGTFYVDKVEDGTLPVFAMELGRTDCSGSCLGDANSDNDVDGADIAELIAKLAQAECR
jgi:hypothetical protein